MALKLKPWNKIWFPNPRIILVKPRFPDPAATELEFRVPPKMTKHELADVLRSVYGFNVASIHTSIHPGKTKYSAKFRDTPAANPGERPSFKMVSGRTMFRTPAFKKATIILNPTAAAARARELHTL